MGDLFHVNEEFFVIHSDDLESVQTRLYGFCIARENIITCASDIKDADELTPDGAYLYVHREGNTITILQDFVGCYGLYLYEDGEYWALSNSFLYLVDDIKTKREITFNKKYADHFLVSGLSAVSYEGTLVNEIRWIDRSAEITIDVDSHQLKMDLRDYGENTLDLDSPEGMAALDDWYEKWTGIIRNLKSKTNNISTDLSGGFDSRVVLGLFLGSGVDMNEVYVNSAEDGLHTHQEDLEIATDIAEHFRFELNNTSYLNTEKENFSMDDLINLSFYLKLGFHTQMHWKPEKFQNYRYSFTGSGTVRDVSAGQKNWRSEPILIASNVKDGMAYGVGVAQSVQDDLSSTFQGIREKFDAFGCEIPAEDACYYFHRETRNRNHFGKWILESFFSGIFNLCPLLDSRLHRLKRNSVGCSDQNLLVTVIFDRYNGDLLNFKIEGDRNIQQSTIQYAKDLNKKYPRTVNQDNKTIRFEGEEIGVSKAVDTEGKTEENTPSNDPVSMDALCSHIKDAFYAPEVKSTFEMLYSTKSYYKLAQRWEATAFYPDANAYVVLAIARIFRDCQQSWEIQKCTSIADYIEEQANHTSIESRRMLSTYNEPYFLYAGAIRLDIKNEGADENDIDIRTISDQGAVIATPDWFAKNGKGYMICADRGTLALSFVCKGEGDLQIAFRTMDVRDTEGKRVQIWIDAQRLLLDGGTEFDYVHTLSHDYPYRIKRHVKDGEEMTLSIEWTPHNETLGKTPEENRRAKGMEDIANLEKKLQDRERNIEELEDKVRSLNKKIDMQKEKNQELREKRDSWKEKYKEAKNELQDIRSKTSTRVKRKQRE